MELTKQHGTILLYQIYNAGDFNWEEFMKEMTELGYMASVRGGATYYLPNNVLYHLTATPESAIADFSAVTTYLGVFEDDRSCVAFEIVTDTWRGFF